MGEASSELYIENNRIYNNNFEILSKNNTDELIFYKMLERKKKMEEKNTIHLPSEKEKNSA